MFTNTFLITRILAGDDFMRFAVRNDVPFAERGELKALWDSLVVETERNLFAAYGVAH